MQQVGAKSVPRPRIVGDGVFLSGVAALAWFMLGLRTGWSLGPDEASQDSPIPAQPRRAAREELVGAGR